MSCHFGHPAKPFGSSFGDCVTALGSMLVRFSERFVDELDKEVFVLVPAFHLFWKLK